MYLARILGMKIEDELVFLLYSGHFPTFERRFIKFPFCPSPDITVHKLPFSFVLNPQAIFSIRITMGCKNFGFRYFKDGSTIRRIQSKLKTFIHKPWINQNMCSFFLILRELKTIANILKFEISVQMNNWI